MATRQINQPLVREQVQTAKMTTLGASQTVPYGSYAVNVGGVIKAVAAATAGQTPLGISMQPLKETTAADYTLAEPAMFARNVEVIMDIDAGDAPGQTEIGKLVYFTDGSTVHKTVAANDVSCTLLEIISSTQCKVRV